LARIWDDGLLGKAIARTRFFEPSAGVAGIADQPVRLTCKRAGNVAVGVAGSVAGPLLVSLKIDE
jgi:hypothetical protein